LRTKDTKDDRELTQPHKRNAEACTAVITGPTNQQKKKREYVFGPRVHYPGAKKNRNEVGPRGKLGQS